jgi:hypothetical protein
VAKGIVSAVLRIADCALALGPRLGVVEVNPLLVAGERVEALDILIVTR